MKQKLLITSSSELKFCSHKYLEYPIDFCCFLVFIKNIYLYNALLKIFSLELILGMWIYLPDILLCNGNLINVYLLRDTQTAVSCENIQQISKMVWSFSSGSYQDHMKKNKKYKQYIELKLTWNSIGYRSDRENKNE